MAFFTEFRRYSANENNRKLQTFALVYAHYTNRINCGRLSRTHADIIPQTVHQRYKSVEPAFAVCNESLCLFKQ